MAEKKKVQRVPCSKCGEPKYVSLPVPVPYVCKPCRAKAKVGQAAKAAANAILGRDPIRESSDPFVNDNIRKRAINAASQRGGEGWIPKRPGWFGRWR